MMWRALLLLLTMPVAFAKTDNLSPQRKQVLHELLMNDCGACHGLTLTGGLGPSLLPDALAGKSNTMLVNTILHGRKGTAMPPWEKLINAQEADWLVQYLKKPR